MAKMKIHPLAETYPPMNSDELEALTEDIKARGLQRPIVLYEGMILDGRNRSLACERAGVEPTFTDYEGDDPLGQVNSLNLNRDLTSAQRAIVAARQWMMNGDTTKRGGKRLKDQSDPCSKEALARQFRVSVNTISQARDLLADAPDLAKQVETCSTSLASAHAELQARHDRAKQQKKDAERAAQYAAEYREAISNGETDPGRIFAEMERRHREERQRAEEDASARQIWFDGLRQTIKWTKGFVADRDDDHLAWYSEPNEPGAQHGIPIGDIEATIQQLRRIKTITFERKPHVPT